MKNKNISVIALALGTVVLTGCISDQTAQVNEKDIQKVFAEMQNSPSAKFIAAENLRDAKAMFTIAQDVAKKNPEAGKKMYKRCAFVAAMQQNKTLLNEVIALDSSLKNYNTLIQRRKVPSLLPQLVKVGSIAEVSKLAKGQQPVWGSFITDCYADLSKEDAEVIALNVNSARESFSADYLLATAKDLVKYKAKANTPACFTVKQLVTEALNLAEVSQSKTTLTGIADFTKQNKIFSAREQKELEATVQAASKTRASYVNFNTRQATRTRTYRQGRYNVTNVRLADGTSMSYRSDSVEDAIVGALKSSPKLRRGFNRAMTGRNSSHMSSGTMQQVASTAALMIKQKGISADQALTEIANAMSDF
ncbi:MAG: hypothetical protein IKB25_09420 [Lentisphaeria bacterium]|nr:hypothetical protein [Lentisphaeria bacterium]